MPQSIFYRLFRVGAIPAALRRDLEQEGIVFCQEGVSGRMVMRDVQGPGRRFVGRITAFVGSVSLTRKRLVACSFSRPIIDVALDDPRLQRLSIGRAKPGWVSIAFDVGDFQSDWSGLIEIRYRLGQEGVVAETLIRSGALDRRAQR